MKFRENFMSKFEKKFRKFSRYFYSNMDRFYTEFI